MHSYAYISRTEIWALDEVGFNINFVYILKLYLIFFSKVNFFLLLHKSENTVNSKKNCHHFCRDKISWMVYDQIPL